MKWDVPVLCLDFVAVVFFETSLCMPGCPKTPCGVKDDPELLILLPLTPEQACITIPSFCKPALRIIRQVSNRKSEQMKLIFVPLSPNECSLSTLINL